MNCRHCNSDNLAKNGRDRHSRQIWKCRDCGRYTTEGANPDDTGGGRKPRKWNSDAERMRAKRKEKKDNDVSG